MLKSIDPDRRLYVVAEGTGYSCLGFEVAEEWRRKYLGFAGITNRPDVELGTEAHYAAYRTTLNLAERHATATGTRCESFLHPQLCGLEGKRVEVVEDYPDAKPRRFYVGRSCGWAPIHLEISRCNSHDGPGVTSRPYRSVRVVGRL